MTTVPSYTTFVAGAVLTAAQLNTNVRDAGNFWLARPLCLLRQTSVQSLSNNSFGDILFDTEDIDRDGGHSTVTNTARYTSPTSGYIAVSGGVAFAANATGRRAAQWALNGTAINASQNMETTTATGNPTLSARTFAVPVNGSTDYVTLQGYQDSGGALNTFATGNVQPNMYVLWISTL